MNTESTIATKSIDRVAELALVRVVDFERIAKEAVDGKITVEALQAAGDFVVVIRPNGRNASEKRVKVASHVTGAAWLDGFVACAELRKRVPKTREEKEDAKKKREAAKQANGGKPSRAASAGK